MGYLRKIERHFEIARQLESEIDSDAEKLIKAAQLNPTPKILREMQHLISSKEKGITQTALAVAIDYVKENTK